MKYLAEDDYDEYYYLDGFGYYALIYEGYWLNNDWHGWGKQDWGLGMKYEGNF